MTRCGPRLQDRTALVTGGTRGIGRHLVADLIGRGARVHFCGRSPEAVAEVCAALPDAIGHVADVADPTDRERLVADVVSAGGIDVLINNAGVGRIVDLVDSHLADPEMEIEVNLIAPIRLTVQLLPHLRQAGEATILNVGSALAYVPMAAEALYCASKAGLHAWSQSLRHQLATTNVRVVEVLLPTVDTTMAAPFDVAKITPAAAAARIAGAVDGRRDEIRIGQGRALYAMSRIAPGFIFNQLNRTPIQRPDPSVSSTAIGAPAPARPV